MSVQMRVLSVLLRGLYKPRMATAERARKAINAVKADPAPPARAAARHRVHRRSLEGFDCYTVIPRSAPAPAKAVIYLHGGAYIDEITKEHWSFVFALADAGMRVEVPIYGLAPRHTYREAFPFLTAVYRDLLQTCEAEAVFLAGDSAGGGLALALAQDLAASALPRPGRLILLSPWLDITMSHPDIPVVERRDPWLSSVGLIEAGRAWAAGDDPRDPRLSPVHGDLTGLPPVELFVGTHDVLYPDALLLRERAPHDVQVNLHVVRGAFHVYVLTPVPEGRHAIATIAQILQKS
ncbi:alpha/beta hydrolase [Streptosporangium sp. NPDC001681]|uniref:alpha/beta hydrolase n=1 Tax=Streptosporangium sp. NPDC001681 TaxID=3154395 RepID=UPI003322243D